MLQVSESIDIAAPIDAVFQWVSDDAYIAVWDTETISSASGHTVRRRGADLKLHREQRFQTPPTMSALELEGEQSERIQFDLAPAVNGTTLTVTMTMHNPTPEIEAQITNNLAQVKQIVYAQLELIKSYVEGGNVAAEQTPIEEPIVLGFLSDMTDAGQQAWETASPFARKRALHAVTSGTNTARPDEAWLAVELANAVMQKTRPRALAFLIGLALVDIAIIVYSVMNGSFIVAGVFVVILAISLFQLFSRLKIRKVISTGFEANSEFLLNATQVDHLLARLHNEGQAGQIAAINELGAMHCANSLNRRIEVALERAAASPDPAVASAATNALGWRHGQIAQLLQQQAA